MTVRQRFVVARVAYVAIILLATLSSLHFSGDAAAARERLARAFRPSLGWRDAVDGLRNVVLFAGLGCVWLLTVLDANVRRAARQAVVVAFCTSVTVEALQLFSPVRTASVVDVASNTLGGLAGAVATLAVLGAVQRARRDKSYVGIPTMLIAVPYALAALCECLAPLFQSSPTPAEGGPISRLTTALGASVPIDWLDVPAFDVPLFAAAGFLLVALVRERRGVHRGEWVVVALGAAVAAVAAHVLHGTFALAIHWEAALTDAVALVAGAWAAERWLGALTQTFRGAARARVAFAGYAILLALWGLRPLVPELEWQAIAAKWDVTALIPLASLAERVDVFSAVHVAQQFFLYFPLGALLAVWPLRRAGWTGRLWPGVWIAAGVELGHVVITERTFDITNVLLALSGLVLGWLVVRRCGYQPYGTALADVAPAAA